METYHGFVRTPADAIKLFEACRLGLLPRVQRRLSEKERQSIRSGSVFIWDESESGMRRWTDGKSWSASRVAGSFLTYREMEHRRSSFGSSKHSTGKTLNFGHGSNKDYEVNELEGDRFKADGLVKQSFSITTSIGQHLHLISYYSRQHRGSRELQQPSSDLQLRHITPVWSIYSESSLHNSSPTPKVKTELIKSQPPYRAQQHHQQPMLPQRYPSDYAQQQRGYSRLLSPMANPPYSHGPPFPYPPQQQPQHHLPPPQAPWYAQAPPAHDLSPYEGTTLPPLNTQKSLVSNALQYQLPRLAQIQALCALESSRVSCLQDQAAQALLTDPRLSSRKLQDSLPGVSAVSAPPCTHHPIMHTSPNGALSLAPHRSTKSGTYGALAHPAKKTGLALLMHPTPACSEGSKAQPTGSIAPTVGPVSYRLGVTSGGRDYGGTKHTQFLVQAAKSGRKADSENLQATHPWST